MSKKVDFLTSIKSLGVDELKAKIAEDELRLKKVSFAHSISPLENPMSIRSLTKDLARLKTALRSKELGLNLNHKFCNNERSSNNSRKKPA